MGTQEWSPSKTAQHLFYGSVALKLNPQDQLSAEVDLKTEKPEREPNSACRLEFEASVIGEAALWIYGFEISFIDWD